MYKQELLYSIETIEVDVDCLLINQWINESSVCRTAHPPLQSLLMYYFNVFLNNFQALSISQSLNLSLSLRDRDRADTWHYNHFPQPPSTGSPSYFCTEKIGLIGVTINPLSLIGLRDD